LHDDKTTFRIGACGSQLSRLHAGHVEKMLKKKHPAFTFESIFVESKNDNALEKALLCGDFDFVVYSQKDLPPKDAKGLTIGAVLKRENPGDVLISRNGYTLESLPAGAKVGTNNLRCKGQLLFARKDLNVVEISGSLESQLARALDENESYDAIVVVYASLKRLKREDLISEVLSLDYILPGPGQGALAVQCADIAQLTELLAPIHDEKSYLATLAERSYWQALGGGRNLPIAVFGQVARKMLTLEGAVIAPDGSEKNYVAVTIDLPSDVYEDREAVVKLGQKLAKVALEDGAAAMMGQSA
jgi:hydroxymethylbilane synthase